MRTTIKDIAERAGVSIATVSLILNKKDRNFAPATREKVLKVVKESNYIPNQVASSMITKKTKTIGIIIPDIQNPFFSEIIKHVEYEIKKRGYNIILCCSYWNPEEDIKYINLLSAKGVDGLMIALSADSEKNSAIVEKLNSSGIAFISLDRWVDGLNCSRVSIDHRQGAYLATKYLIDKGHKKIGCITGAMTSYTARRRLQGYEEAMRDAGLEVKDEWKYNGDYQFESGCSGGKELLKTDITAVFTSNDVMAYGFYRAAKEANCRIPEDVSVVGFDDLAFSGMLDVGLTSVKQSVEMLAKKATECLFKEITERKFVHIDVKLQPVIIERESVREL